MAKDFKSSSDVSPDIRSDTGGDTGLDSGVDLAGVDGVDLNAGAGDISKTKNTTMKAVELPPEMNQYMQDVPAQYEVIDMPQSSTIEQLQTDGWVITDGTTDGPKPDLNDSLLNEARFLEEERRRESQRQREAANAASQGTG